MRKSGLFLLAVFTLTCATAQDSADKYAAFHLSFIPPLSSNGIKANEYTNGASFNLLAGISRNEENFSLAGLSNVITHDAKGFQWAGLSNFIGNNGRGMLFSGLANVVKGAYNGFQWAGVVNYAKEINGFQWAGVVNYAKEINGFQWAGVINIAQKVSGVQFGLLNIANENDYPIGVINIIKKNREMGVALTYDFIGNSILSFRSGTKYTYGIFGLGYNHKAKGNKFVQEAGFGAHILCCKWFRINNELKVSAIGSMSETPSFNAGYSLLPSIKISRHYHVFGGVSINYLASKDDTGLFSHRNIWNKYTEKRLQQLYIGYQAGIQYIF